MGLGQRRRPQRRFVTSVTADQLVVGVSSEAMHRPGSLDERPLALRVAESIGMSCREKGVSGPIFTLALSWTANHTILRRGGTASVPATPRSPSRDDDIRGSAFHHEVMSTRVFTRPHTFWPALLERGHPVMEGVPVSEKGMSKSGLTSCHRASQRRGPP